MKVEITAKAVNSKVLVEHISGTIKDGIHAVEMTWGNDEERSIFLEYINSLLHEAWNAGKIEQWKVQCNSLNNNADDILNGMFVLDVHFKQKHCLNVTKLRYTIRENE